MVKRATKIKKTQAAGANPMWGGHFAVGPAEAMQKINASIDFDKALYADDIDASLAHAGMLAKQKIISAKDGAAIKAGLLAIRKEIDKGEFRFRRDLEDIHMNVELRLAELIGDAAGRLHTARSRNDQVATDLRLWVRRACTRLDTQIRALQSSLLAQAEEYCDAVMPGFTHLQPAQPVTFGHHLLAYVEMLGRDRSRFADAASRLNESPLGACALAGTSFPTDRHATARSLGFDRPMANSLDAVSDRDFAVEFLSACALASIHLSRLAEECIVWSTPAFGFLALPEAFTSGSSIMPQKRNPDAAELVRGNSGRIVGGLVGLLMTLKALPLAYNKDMQEDKEPVFEAYEQLALCLAAMRGMMDGMKANRSRMEEAAAAGYSTATDIADWLVQHLNMPFRQAHHVTGRIVKLAEKKNARLSDLSLQDLQSIEPAITHLTGFAVNRMDLNRARSRSSGRETGFSSVFLLMSPSSPNQCLMGR